MGFSSNRTLSPKRGRPGFLFFFLVTLLPAFPLPPAVSFCLSRYDEGITEGSLPGQ